MHSIETRTVRRAWLVLAGAAVAAWLLGPSAAIAVPNFRILLVCETIIGAEGSAPVSDSLTCSGAPFGSFQASATASFGSVGARTSASTFRGDASGQTEAAANFFDLITFTKTDPTAPDELLVSVNLDFGGILNAGATAGFDAAAQYEFGVSGILGQFSGRGLFTVSGGLSVIPSGLGEGEEGVIVPGPEGFVAALRSPAVLLNFFGANSIVGPFQLTLITRAGSRGPGGSALADFAGTLEFPTGVDVFNLPPGYTVNAGDYLVNNRFVGEPVAVPAPPALGLLAAGAAMAGLVGAARRSITRRR